MRNKRGQLMSNQSARRTKRKHRLSAFNPFSGREAYYRSKVKNRGIEETVVDTKTKYM